jgi:fibronectin-binding autotransporter adhesin
MKLTDSSSLKVGPTGVSMVASSSPSSYAFHVLQGPFGIKNTVSATPVMWFDASDATTLFTDVAGTTPATAGQSIARWNSKVGNYNFQQPTAAARPILVGNSIQNKPVLNMGSLTSGQYLLLMLSNAVARYDAASHTIFWVLKGSNFLLCDNVFYDFHRGLIGNQLGPTNPIWDATYAQASVLNGATTLNRVSVTGTSAGLTGGYDVVGLTTASGTARFNNLGTDRGYSFRTGGMEYAEILIYSGTLSASDRTIVENYLSDKWQGATKESTVTLALSGSSALEKTGAGNLVLTGANTYTGSTTISAGSLKISSSGLINSTSAITNNGSLIYDKSGVAITLPAITGTGSLTASVLGAALTSAGNITGGAISIATSAQMGGRGFFLGGNIARTITGTSISISGQVGQSSNTASSLTLNTSSANGPITIGFQNGEGGWWFGLQSITANAGTGSVTISGSRPSAESFNASSGVTLTGEVAISTSATLSISGNLNINATANSTISSAVTLSSGRTYNFNVSSGITLTANGVLGGTNVPLVKTGAGTLALGSAAHTYTGQTTISLGAITVSKTVSGVAANATFTTTSLTVDFGGVTPTTGSAYRFFQGATSPTGLTVLLTNAGGKTGSYNFTNSTLTIN